MDLKGMQLGAVFPHNEIGTNPADIKTFAQGVEALGCLLYTSPSPRD